jgi:hypothetical protein
VSSVFILVTLCTEGRLGFLVRWSSVRVVAFANQILKRKHELLRWLDQWWVVITRHYQPFKLNSLTIILLPTVFYYILISFLHLATFRLHLIRLSLYDRWLGCSTNLGRTWAVIRRDMPVLPMYLHRWESFGHKRHKSRASLLRVTQQLMLE